MKKRVKLATLLTVCMLFVLSLTACGGSSKLDLSDYLSVTFNGADGNGTAYLDFDAAQMELDYAGVKNGSPSQEELEKMLSLAQFEFSITYDLDSSEGLSNGDKITATVYYDESLADDAKLKIGSTTKSFTVEGLTEPIVIDPFDESVFGVDKTVRISYEDIAPYAYLNIENNADAADPISRVSYTADEAYNLRNGDVITITASLSDEDAQEGYVLSETETSITVEGLDYYVESADDLTPEFLQTVSDRAYNECLAADNADIYEGSDNFWPWDSSISNIHVGDTALLMTANSLNTDGSRWNYYGYSSLLVPVYKTISTDSWYNNDTMENEYMEWNDVFSYYVFKGIVVHTDGSITYDDSYIECNGNYTDSTTADTLFLNQFAADYTTTEISMN